MIDAVLEMLDRKDMFVLRLTCKALCSHATPMAFDKLHVWLEHDSLQRLVNIARHPQLRTHVDRIAFGMERFYDVDVTQFEDDIYSETTWDKRTSIRDESEDTLKEDAWSVYHRYYERQCTLEQSNTDVTMMTEALEAFISLKKIDLLDSQPWNVDCRQESWGIRREGLILDLMLAVPPHAHKDFPRGGRQLYVLLRALAERSINLEKLSLQLFASNISTGGFYSPLPADNLSLAIPAFVGLKRLSLRLEIIQPLVMEQWKLPSKESPLTTILRAATGLEILWLALPDGLASAVWPVGAGCCWRDFIQIHRFGHLKELRIDGAILDEADFVAFLLQSCQRLQTLSLGMARVIEGPWSRRSSGEPVTLANVTVIEGTWNSIFEAIRSLPVLEEIELYYLWQELDQHGFYALNDEADMDPEPLYAFLLRRREDNPWLSMCQGKVAQNLRGKADATQSEEGDEGQ